MVKISGYITFYGSSVEDNDYKKFDQMIEQLSPILDSDTLEKLEAWGHYGDESSDPDYDDSSYESDDEDERKFKCEYRNFGKNIREHGLKIPNSNITIHPYNNGSNMYLCFYIFKQSETKEQCGLVRNTIPSPTVAEQEELEAFILANNLPASSYQTILNFSN